MMITTHTTHTHTKPGVIIGTSSQYTGAVQYQEKCGRDHEVSKAYVNRVHEFKIEETKSGLFQA